MNISSSWCRRWEIRFPLLAWWLASLLASAPLRADEPASPLLEQLQQAAQQNLTDWLTAQRWQAEGVELQPKLPDGAAHLPPCQQPVSLSRSNPTAPPWGRQSFLLRCPDSPGWQSRGEVTVRLMLKVWVAARTLEKGQALQAADLQPQLVELSTLRRSFSPVSDSLLGYLAPRRIRMGELLSRERLDPPLAVHKGDVVMITAQQDGFSASTQGVAEADGHLGEVIPVRNSSSGKRIKARVSGPQQVESLF